MANFVVTVIAFLLAAIFSVCSAGDYCTRYSYSYSYPSSYTTSEQYCVYGCCGVSNQDCCSGPIGLIVGLCVGGAVFLFFVILTICICRRRRYAGVVYRNGLQPGPVVVQQSTTTQNGTVTTAGVQPGVTYPPYPQYQYQYAGAYPGPSVYPSGATYPQPGYPPPMQTGAAYPPQPVPYSADPPKYDSLNLAPDGGVPNQGYDYKN